MKKRKTINIWGLPGTGKTTFGNQIYSFLKSNNFLCEFNMDSDSNSLKNYLKKLDEKDLHKEKTLISVFIDNDSEYFDLIKKTESYNIFLTYPQKDKENLNISKIQDDLESQLKTFKDADFTVICFDNLKNKNINIIAEDIISYYTTLETIPELLNSIKNPNKTKKQNL